MLLDRIYYVATGIPTRLSCIPGRCRTYSCIRRWPGAEISQIGSLVSQAGPKLTLLSEDGLALRFQGETSIYEVLGTLKLGLNPGLQTW